MELQIIERTVPNGETDKTLQVSCASSAMTDAVVLASLPYPPDRSMIFSVWALASVETQIMANVLGTNGYFTVGTGWTRLSLSAAEPTGQTVRLIPMSDATLYLYQAQLEMGEIASDWKAAPEDDAEELGVVRDAVLSLTPECIVGYVTASTPYQQLAGQVEVQAGQIASKVSQTDFNALGQRVSSAESAISQTPDQISAAVKAIQIGGTNLVQTRQGAIWTLNASVDYTWSDSHYSHGKYGIVFDAVPGPIPQFPEPGSFSAVTFLNEIDMDASDYVLSFWCWRYQTNTAPQIDAELRLNGSPLVAIGSIMPQENTPKRYELPIKLTEPNSLALYFIASNLWQTGVVSISDVKLEKGTKATAWSPAPGDTDAEINGIGTRVSSAESSITQQAGEIATKVSQTDFNALGQRVSDAESSITQQAGQIATKVSQTDFNALGQRVSDTESSISQQAGQIATKVSQTDFDSLGQRVASAESSITQQAGQIASKVSQTDFDSLAGRVSGAESSITQQAGQIAAKASQTEVDSLTGRVSSAEASINLVPDQINAAVNDIDEFHSGSVISMTRDKVYIGTPEYEVEINDDPDFLQTYIKANASGAGITYTWDESTQTYDVNGTATAASYRKIAPTSGREFPSWVVPGGTYRVYYEASGSDSTVANLNFYIYFYSSTTTATAFASVKATNGAWKEFTVPSNAVHWNIDLNVARNGTVNHVRAGNFAIKNAGEPQTFHMDRMGASMDTLSVNRLFVPNMAEKYTGAFTVTIGTGGTFASFAEFCNAVSNHVLTYNIGITILNDLYENVDLSGIVGAGSIWISGGNHTINGNVNIGNNSSWIGMENLTINGTATVGNSTAAFHSVIFNGNGATNALNETTGSCVDADGCQFYNATSLIRAAVACQFRGYNLSGGNCTNCIEAAQSTVYMEGTRPDGTVSLWGCIYAGDPSALTIDYGSATPVVPPTQTATLACTNSGTHYPSGHWYGGGDKRVRQGFVNLGTSGNNELQGCIWFDTSAISGHTVLSALLTLTRAAGYGRGSDVNVRLYTTPLTGTSGNPLTNAVDYGVIGSIANGETKQFTIPTAAVQALASGTMSGLMLQIGDGALISGRTYSVNYAHFWGYGETTPPSLMVTYQ